MPSLLDLRPDPIIQRLNDWMDNWDPLHRDGFMRRDHMIRVEETMRDGTLEIRAELPGIDPDDDVEIDLADGLLTISAERSDERSESDDGRTFSEFRYGSFRRSLRVPADTDASKISAEYRHGILMITVPMPSAAKAESTRIPIKKK
jgi:HSP20 family protein